MTTVANGSTIRHLNIPAGPTIPSSGSTAGSSTNSDKTKYPTKPALSLLIPSSSPTEPPPPTQQSASNQPWVLVPTRHSTKATLLTVATYTCAGTASPSPSPSPSLTKYIPTVASDTARFTASPFRSTPNCTGTQYSTNAYGINAVDGTLSLTIRPTGWTLQTFGPSIRRLGAGTGGCVDLHRTAATAKVVAIKTLQNKARSTTSTREPDNSGSRSPESSNSSILSRRVLEELGIAVNMRHRNIISTHEVIVETGQTCYVVMEACSVDLLTLIQGRQQKLPNGCILPSNKAAMDGYFVQLVQGVHYLHSIGVGHRDLKLDNICITEKGVLKIVDFGCATLFRRRIQHQLVPKSSSSHASARLARERAAPYSVPNPQQIQAVRTGGSHGHQYVETLSYGMCGSDPYMAPELFGSGYYMAPRVDIWALGIIYFAMQHQQFPWAVAQASRDTRYKAFEKAPEAFVETWFSETPTDDATIGRKGEEGFFESLGSWSLVPSSPGVNFLNMTQKKCHPDDSHVFQTTAEVSGRMSVRRIVRRMLDINPASRADINELVSDPWFKAMCQQSEKQL